MGRTAGLLALTLLLASGPAPALAATDLATDQLLLARERGGGHGGGGHRARTGLGQRSAGFDRGSRRPDGGWSRRLGDGDRARRDFDRARNRLHDGSRDWERARDRIGRVDADRIRRNFGPVERSWREVQRDVGRELGRELGREVRREIRGWDNDWPGWVRPGWGLARPWRTGWYGSWSRPPWGWWGGRSLAWGVGTLATTAVIASAVNAAIEASQPTIKVPDSGYTLHYPTVAPSGEQSVHFTASTGEQTFEATADCDAGTLNGREPASAAQAQLVNAACQVAFSD
jgi:hypothetical protein